MSTPEGDSAARIFTTNLILIGNVFRHSGFKLAAIDQVFINHGADPQWKIKAPISIHNSKHIDAVSGWLQGINRFDPHKTLPIIRAVLMELVESGSTVSYEHRQLVGRQIQRIDRFLNPPTPAEAQDQLHQRVLDAASAYWSSGHYTKAVQNTFVALISLVATMAERPDQDGDGLMRHVFSQDSPLLRVSETRSEQRGYMDLFAGSVLAIRNPLSHTSDEALTREEANELLGFASFLFRTLDKARKFE